MANTKRLWSQKVFALKPYIPGEQPREKMLIKLNTNENPYGPSPAVKQAIDNYNPDNLRLYPDPECRRLRAVIAARNRLQLENIFVGNGSDEILALAFQAFFAAETGENAHILFPDITYSFYPVYCRMYSVQYRTILLDENLAFTAADIPAGGRGLVIANPNAPTGRCISIAEVEKMLLADRNRLLLVDEAYVDFGGDSALPLLRKYDNLLIVQTLSKSRSLAGMRVGYALGAPELIEALERVRDSFNSYTVNSLSQISALAAFEDEKWFQEKCAAIIATREFTSRELKKFGFVVIPSRANFIFVRHPDFSGDYLYSRLRHAGILVRHFNLPRIEQYLRISIGTQADMCRLLQALTAILNTDI